MAISKEFADKATEVFPVEIDIKIKKDGKVLVCMDGTPIGMLQQLLLFADANNPVPVLHMTQVKIVDQLVDGHIVGQHSERDQYTCGAHTIGLEDIAKVVMKGADDDS